MNWRWLFGSCGCLLIAAFSWAGDRESTVEPPKTIQMPPVVRSIGGPVTSSPLSTKLTLGKKYIVDHDTPLVFKWRSKNDGEIDVREVKGPHSYAGSLVITVHAADGDGVVVVPGPFIYEVTVKSSGSGDLCAWPSLNRQDKEGKPIPFTSDDMQFRELEVDDGTAPRPPPKPDVKPDTNPSPTKLEGLHVLIGEESSRRTKIPPSQANILTSTVLQEFLNENCVTESVTATDRVKAWRVYDKDAKINNESEWVKTVMGRKHDTDFWIYVSNGHQWEECPLPKTIAEVKALVAKYKGDK